MLQRDGKKENGKFRKCEYAYCKGQLCNQFDGRHLKGFKKCDSEVWVPS